MQALSYTQSNQNFKRIIQNEIISKIKSLKQKCLENK